VKDYKNSKNKVIYMYQIAQMMTIVRVNTQFEVDNISFKKINEPTKIHRGS